MTAGLAKSKAHRVECNGHSAKRIGHRAKHVLTLCTMHYALCTMLCAQMCLFTQSAFCEEMGPPREGGFPQTEEDLYPPRPKEERLKAMPIEQPPAIIPEELAATKKIESSGELVTLDVENTDIRDVAKALARVGETNIVVSEDVKALVTAKIKDVHWEKALDMLLKTYNLTSVRDENFIRITSFAGLKAEQESVHLTTKVVRLNFVDLEDIKKSLSALSTMRGKIEMDKRTNSLLITDVPMVADKIAEVAEGLDIQTPQVMIEAMIVDVKLTDDDNLGFDWTIFNEQDLGVSPSTKFTQSLKPTDTVGSLTFGKVVGNINVSGVVAFLQKDKKAEILASPKVATLDNYEAKIELIEEVPYTQVTQSTESSSAISTTAFKQAGIKLYVTPHITKDGFISMNIKPEQSFVVGFTSKDNQPIIDTRKSETNVLVNNGETVVIAGLRRAEDTVTIERVPLLGDIPLFGGLFKRKTKSQVMSDLLIFVTPRLIKETRLTQDELKKYDRLNDKLKPLPERMEKERNKLNDIIEEMKIYFKEKRDSENAKE